MNKTPLFLAVSAALLAALIPMLFPPAAHSGTRATVTDVRQYSYPNYTRVVIDVEKGSKFTHRLLKKDPSINKPRRLYVDIENSVLGSGIQKTIPIDDGLLKRARAGQYDRDTVRVVLDIQSIEDYKIFPLSDPFRIVIDVTGEGGAGRGAASAEARRAPPVKIPQTLQARQGRRPVIVIDPGHGGKDPGAIGRGGLKEKDVTLRISKMLKQELERRLDAKIVLTRDRDVYIPLEERTAIANSLGADLFISIHINASPRRSAKGLETYILNTAFDEDARQVAMRENASTRKGLSDLEFIIKDLVATAKTNDSVKLANSVHSSLVRSVRERYRDVRSNGVKGGPFYVLFGTQMESILVETSFISNPTEEKRLRDRRYLQKIVDGIADGAVRYIKTAGMV